MPMDGCLSEWCVSKLRLFDDNQQILNWICRYGILFLSNSVAGMVFDCRLCIYPSVFRFCTLWEVLAKRLGTNCFQSPGMGSHGIACFIGFHVLVYPWETFSSSCFHCILHRLANPLRTPCVYLSLSHPGQGQTHAAVGCGHGHSF